MKRVLSVKNRLEADEEGWTRVAGRSLFLEQVDGSALLFDVPLEARSVPLDPARPAHARRELFDIPLDVEMTIDADESSSAAEPRLRCVEFVIRGVEISQAAIRSLPVTLLIREAVRLGTMHWHPEDDEDPDPSDLGESVPIEGPIDWDEVDPRGRVSSRTSAEFLRKPARGTRSKGRPPAIPDHMLQEVARVYRTAAPHRQTAAVRQHFAQKLGRPLARSSAQRAIDRAAEVGFLPPRVQPPD